MHPNPESSYRPNLHHSPLLYNTKEVVVIGGGGGGGATHSASSPRGGEDNASRAGSGRRGDGSSGPPILPGLGGNRTTTTAAAPPVVVVGRQDDEGRRRNHQESSLLPPPPQTTETSLTSPPPTRTRKRGRKRRTVPTKPFPIRRRRSSRGNSSISTLAGHIVSGKNVVFITGAGVSVGSGVRPFRGKDGLWGEVVWSNATRESFRRDPLTWYNTFWLPHFHQTSSSPKPNPSHEALAQLTLLPNSNVKIITQNVDGLHSSTSTQWDWQNKLIEAHGRLGLYKCIPETDSDTDDESDEEESRMVKLGSLRKARALRTRRMACAALEERSLSAEKEKSAGAGESGGSLLCEEVIALTEEEEEEGQKENLASKSEEILTPSTEKGQDEEKKKSHPPVCRYEIEESISVHQLEPPIVRSILQGKGGNSDYRSVADNGRVDRAEKERGEWCSGSSGGEEKKCSDNENSDVGSSKGLEEHDVRGGGEGGFSRSSSLSLTDSACSVESATDEEKMTKGKEEEGGGLTTDAPYAEHGTTSAITASPKTKPQRKRHRRQRRRRNQPTPPPLLPTPPLCPSCQRPCPPQALLFDEGYHSHSHYQFEKMEHWIASAHVLVFVGTSFAVTVTDVALSHAREARLPVFNFNLANGGEASESDVLESTSRLNAENILGDCEVTLKGLVECCEEEVGRRLELGCGELDFWLG